MEKVSRLYNFVRSRQLEGTYSSDPSVGCWPITAYRISCGWGNVPEQDWPASLSRDWPPEEAPGLDLIAKKQRIECYQRVRSVEECKRVLRRGYDVYASFEITHQWKYAKDGIIKKPPKNVEITGSNNIRILDYEDSHKLFKFENSWGIKWGDKGYGWLPYEYFKSYLIESWIEYTLEDNNLKKELHPLSVEIPQLIGYSFQSIFRNKFYVFEIYDELNDERIGWCFAVVRNKWLEVEEFFIRPPHRRLGFGSVLARELKKLSSKLNVQLRLWISQIDADHKNSRQLEWLVSYLGLRLSDSQVRWAYYKAEPNVKYVPEEKVERRRYPPVMALSPPPEPFEVST